MIFFDQTTNIFKGRLGWVSWLTIIARILMVIVLVYSFDRFENAAPDIKGMFRWGGLAVFCLLGLLLSKLWLALHMQTHRVLRELKKLELQIASLKQN
jgi:hypothetical protein